MRVLSYNGKAGSKSGLNTEMAAQDLASILTCLGDTTVISWGGGEAQVLAEVEVRLSDHTLGHQKMSLAAPRIAFLVTALGKWRDSFETAARRLLCQAALEAILWADIQLTTVTLTTLCEG